jgi:uncharacterized protein YcbK (DUF882 family)
MGDLTQHFSRREFACTCGCGSDDIALEVVELVEDVRTHFGQPTTINSGVRCLEHNRSLGSKDTSQHVKGTAADIAVKGVDPKDVADYIQAKAKKGWKGGLGRYKRFTHVDVRGKTARWGKN